MRAEWGRAASTTSTSCPPARPQRPAIRGSGPFLSENVDPTYRVGRCASISGLMKRIVRPLLAATVLSVVLAGVALGAARLPSLLTGWNGRYTVRPTSIYYTGDGSGVVGVLRRRGGLGGPGRGYLHWKAWNERGCLRRGEPVAEARHAHGHQPVHALRSQRRARAAPLRALHTDDAALPALRPAGRRHPLYPRPRARGRVGAVVTRSLRLTTTASHFASRRCYRTRPPALR